MYNSRVCLDCNPGVGLRHQTPLNAAVFVCAAHERDATRVAARLAPPVTLGVSPTVSVLAKGVLGRLHRGHSEQPDPHAQAREVESQILVGEKRKKRPGGDWGGAPSVKFERWQILVSAAKFGSFYSIESPQGGDTAGHPTP